MTTPPSEIRSPRENHIQHPDHPKPAAVIRGTSLDRFEMNLNDFTDWQLCWQINLLFYKPEDNQIPQKCIVCSDIYNYTWGTRRSSFWLDATRCSAGHSQNSKTVSQQGSSGVCATCDQMYIIGVVTGRHTCRRKECRRVIRVDEARLRERLLSEKVLLEKFLSLLRRHRVYECVIHCDEVAYDPDSSIAFKSPTPQCDHDRNVCDACLRAAYESAIRGGRLQDLICPDLECRKPIPLESIRSNVSTYAFKIYNKQLALKTISKDENFRWCRCGHGQIHSLGASNPEWICFSCSKRHCYVCEEDSSVICEHLQAIDEQKRIDKSNQKNSALLALSEAAQKSQLDKLEKKADTKREIARITKKCPKSGCCNKIERNSGCGHFKCKMCSTEFCWCCKVIWEDGRALHLNECRIGTRSRVGKENLDQSGYAVGWDRDEGYDLSLDGGLWLVSSQQ